MVGAEVAAARAGGDRGGLRTGTSGEPEVREYFADDLGVLDRREQAHAAATARAGEHVEVEAAPHQVGPDSLGLPAEASQPAPPWAHEGGFLTNDFSSPRSSAPARRPSAPNRGDPPQGPSPTVALDSAVIRAVSGMSR
jgi:hypothetical protein